MGSLCLFAEGVEFSVELCVIAAMRQFATQVVSVSILAGLFFPVSLSAQEDAHVTAPPSEAEMRQQKQLGKALGKMAVLTSLAFTTEEKTLSRQGRANVFAGRGRRGAQIDKKSKGLFAGELLRVEVEEDTILRLGRVTVVGEDGKWGIRSGGGAGLAGAALPLVLDPVILFRLLSVGEMKFSKASVGEWNQRPVQLMSVELDEELCSELVLAGLVPDPRGRGAGLTQVFFGGKRAKPRFEGHAVFAVDPAFGHVVGMRVRLYHDPAKAGRGRVAVQQFQFQVGGGGKPAVPKEILELDEFEEGEVRWKDGLPRRALAKQEVRVDFVVNFAEHGKVEVPELDVKARALLGMK